MYKTKHTTMDSFAGACAVHALQGNPLNPRVHKHIDALCSVHRFFVVGRRGEGVEHWTIASSGSTPRRVMVTPVDQRLQPSALAVRVHFVDASPLTTGRSSRVAVYVTDPQERTILAGWLQASDEANAPLGVVTKLEAATAFTLSEVQRSSTATLSTDDTVSVRLGVGSRGVRRNDTGDLVLASEAGEEWNLQDTWAEVMGAFHQAPFPACLGASPAGPRCVDPEGQTIPGMRYAMDEGGRCFRAVEGSSGDCLRDLSSNRADGKGTTCFHRFLSCDVFRDTRARAGTPAVRNGTFSSQARAIPSPSWGHPRNHDPRPGGNQRGQKKNTQTFPPAPQRVHGHDDDARVDGGSPQQLGDPHPRRRQRDPFRTGLDPHVDGTGGGPAPQRGPQPHPGAVRPSGRGHLPGARPRGCQCAGSGGDGQSGRPSGATGGDHPEPPVDVDGVGLPDGGHVHGAHHHGLGTGRCRGDVLRCRRHPGSGRPVKRGDPPFLCLAAVTRSSSFCFRIAS